ncbi:hypothetical protein [Curtobacterium sp. S6]|uniref:DUF6414 family protein n=1 Tax=Curtobacterium sp. S6 TaxID=1479623 RepID=UPI00128FA037|nr:hypothetical protein [Curtobacterium sp. S6]
MATSASSTEVPNIPIATIYQNSDQVAGILQQIMQHPLLTEGSRELASEDGNDTAADGSASGKGEGRANLSLLGGFKINAEAKAGLSSNWTQTTGTASRQQFVYSQAYNLHLVRQSLRDKNQLISLDSREQAEAVQPGAFVEYTATFDPAELTLALDVISPELVETITRFTVKRDYLLRFPEEGGHEARVKHAEKMDIEAQAKGELARAITNAIKADTRQETTREYYGRVATEPELTLITICDLAHFIVDDPDRLLDGTFTVLGKVISPIEQNMPTFSHNKLLRNLTPEALDDGLKKLRELIDETSGPGQTAPSYYVDLKLDSRVRGSSMRVIPLAIYS